jgi:hypothetical protein
MAGDTVAPGSQTSEARFTAWAMVAGAVIDGVGILLEMLKESAVFSGSWLPVALVVCGTLTMLLAKLGYTRSRTLVKLAALQPQGVKAVSELAPFVRSVREVVREELAARKAPPEEPPPTLPSAT